MNFYGLSDGLKWTSSKSSGLLRNFMWTSTLTLVYFTTIQVDIYGIFNGLSRRLTWTSAAFHVDVCDNLVSQDDLCSISDLLLWNIWWTQMRFSDS
uniref:Uncharacterized protein n=1 Tax=Ditylenchus dipsaci TaxID=166011 RepID=A0A915CZ11_9BILA